MGNISYRNRAFILSQGALGQKISEALDDIQNGVNQTAQQVNANPDGQQVVPPPVPTKLTVTAADGIFDIAIDDNSPLNRGAIYHIEYSLTANFAQPVLLVTGPSRNFRTNLGNQTLYFRAFSQYPTSPTNNPIYFGGGNPTPVVGGGAAVGPTPLPGRGSGTGSNNGLGGGQGYGKLPQRLNTL